MQQALETLKLSVAPLSSGFLKWQLTLAEFKSELTGNQSVFIWNRLMLSKMVKNLVEPGGFSFLSAGRNRLVNAFSSG